MPAGPCLAQQRLVLDVKSHLTTSELLEFMCKAIGAREELETLQVDWELDDWQRDRYEESILRQRCSGRLHHGYCIDQRSSLTFMITSFEE